MSATSSGAQPSTPFADLQDSLLGWSSQTELRLAGELAAQPWFPAAGYTTDQLEAIDRLYGTFLARQVAAGADLAALMEITPSLLAVTLISRAARMRDRNDVTREYLVGLGLRATEAAIAAVDAARPGALARVGLEVVGEPGSVVALTYQAGITAGEVGALLELLDQLPADMAGRDVVDKLASGEYAELLPFDEQIEATPQLPLTAELAGLAPERLAETIDGIQTLRAFSLAHPSSWLDRDRPTLPPLIDAPVVAELRERPVGTVGRASAVGVALRELRPRLIFDPQRRRVCIRLPEQRVSNALGEVSWRVSLGEGTRVFRTGRAWGETEYAEALDIRVDTPLREATVQDTTNSISWVVPIVDSDDPIMVFAANGQNLTGMATLHHARLWVLAPEDATLVDVVTGEDLPVLESLAVRGWASWRAWLIDASAAASLQLVRAGEAPSAMRRLRSIDPRQRVRFVHPVPAIGQVRTGSRLPVYPKSLVAEFPPTLSGEDEIWQLSISAYGGIGVAGELIAPPEPLEVPADGGAFEIFDPEVYDAPWVGEYLIRLLGPRNESFRHRYAIVEDMAVSEEIAGASSTVRIPATGGLSEAALTVRATGDPFDVTPRVVRVGAAEVGADFLVTTEEGDQLPLRYQPAHLSYELPLLAYPPMWRTTRIEVGPRALDPDGTLRIRGVGGMADPRVAVRNRHGSPLRTLKMTSPDDGLTWLAPMATLAATTAVLPSGSLEFEWTDVRSDRRVSVSLARFAPGELAESVSLSDDGAQLIFAGLRPEQRLGAWVWPLTAPWAPAFTLADVAETTPLPGALIGAGDLAVQLFSADAFSALRAPLNPGPGSFTVEAPGYLKEQTAAFAQLSAFLVGESEVPPSEATVMPTLWDHMSIWEGEEGLGRRKIVQKVFATDPRGALRALSRSLVPTGAQPGRVIASGLVTMNGEATAEQAATDAPVGGLQDTSHRSPWLGAFELLNLLPAQFAAVEGAAAGKAGKPERAAWKATLARLRDVAGKNLIDTLATGRDATLDTACIDQTTVRIALMDRAQQKALLATFFNTAEIVPGPFMDDSTRLLAVFEAFTHRERLSELMTTEGLIRPAVSLLRGLRSANRGVYTSARIRLDRLDGVDTEVAHNAWALAPVVSMVFALAARLHAHGLMGKSKTLDQAASGWSQLADIVPDLVTGDLVSAEAMVLAVKYPGIAG